MLRAVGISHSVKASVRPRTYESYCQLIRLYIGPGLGRIRLQKLSATDVQSFLNDRLAAGLSARTVQYVHAVIPKALNQALRWDLIPRNVATLFSPPRVKRPEVQPLTPAEVKTFLTALSGNRLVALYTLVVAVRLRQGEALGLRWEDVNFDRSTLSVRKALQRVEGELRLTESKSSKSRRSLILSPSFMAALRIHRSQQLQERLLSENRWKETGLVFTTCVGTPLDGPGVTRRFQRVLAKAGLPRKRFHDLRHTCASLLLAQGVHPRVIMEILGHSQMSLTMDTYSHVMPTLQEDAARLMESFIRRDT